MPADRKFTAIQAVTAAVTATLNGDIDDGLRILRQAHDDGLGALTGPALLALVSVAWRAASVELGRDPVEAWADLALDIAETIADAGGPA